MAKKKDTQWLYEKRAMQNRFIAIMEYRVPIRDLPEHIDAPAMSTPEPAIYIRKDSDMTKGLPEHKARAVRFGLFTHEMAHLQFSDFYYVGKVCEDMEPWEVPFFKMIWNVIEDPAIENLAGTFIGGYLLKSLKYAIKRSYDISKPIQTFEDPFEQCLNALIQFGDMGPFKGYFTDAKAKKCTFEAIPEMQEAMECGDPKERVDISLRIFEILRPLWEEKAREMYSSMGEEGFEEVIRGMLGAFGKSMSEGSGSGEEVDPEELADAADLSKGARRTTTFKKLEEMEAEEREAYESKSKSEEEEEILEEGEKPEGKERPGGSDEETVVYSDEDIDLSTPADYDPEEYEIEAKAMDFFDRLIQSEIEIDAESTMPSREAEIPDFSEISKKYGMREYKCKNGFVTISNPETAEMSYNRIVKKNLGHINSCYKKLKALFAEEAEETEYRSSGKISVERTVSTTVTSKIFTKSVDPKDKSNMAVMLAIDESGSMDGSRIERAKEAAINLTEIFGKLGIPTYIMGFTADTSGADAVHRHYVDWTNLKAERYALTSIHADSNNFDGYSIRYASKLLGLRPEIHKVLIVISDGQPACHAYSYGDGGYRDTKDAIREARSDGQVVLGVAIGADIDVLQKMYGNDFIFITTGEDLFTGIMKKFTGMVKKW
jgi:cobalamin biosynthesis protein CobT